MALSISSELIEFLATTNSPTEWTLGDVQRDSSHKNHTEVHRLCSEGDAAHVAREAGRAVSTLRLATLRESVDRPRPYDREELADLPVDDNALVQVKEFERVDVGFSRGDTVFEILPSLPALNSSHWVAQSLCGLDGQLAISVRLDPWLRSTVGSPRPFFKMHVYGRPLDWDSVLALREESRHQWMPDEPSHSDICRTDAIWMPRGDEVHLRCEEFPTEKAAAHRPARYFHTIVDRPTRTVTHCDGAIRILDPDEARRRAGVHVGDAGKVGTRVKIFQVDGSLNSEQWSELFQSFFVWNRDVTKFAEQLASG
jgi:hypothetical protein